VVGEVRPGAAGEGEVGEFGAVKIMTGGQVPAGADAVVMIEYTRDAREGEIEVIKAIAAGRVLSALDVGILAALGKGEVEVARRPRVGIISSGDEVVAPGAEIREGAIFDINGYTLSTMVEDGRGAAEIIGIIKDDYDELKDAIKKSLGFDVVVLSGATSVGERDVIPEIVKE
jgi:molybdopterin biosynthesis enzyme